LGNSGVDFLAFLIMIQKPRELIFLPPGHCTRFSGIMEEGYEFEEGPSGYPFFYRLGKVMDRGPAKGRVEFFKMGKNEFARFHCP
jgi:hypothetical protein